MTVNAFYHGTTEDLEPSWKTSSPEEVDLMVGRGIATSLPSDGYKSIGLSHLISKRNYCQSICSPLIASCLQLLALCHFLHYYSIPLQPSSHRHIQPTKPNQTKPNTAFNP